MCFSETASLVAGVTLCGVGAAVLPMATRQREIPLAAIPLLFGIQQLVEGFVWRALETGDHVGGVLVGTYLFFALVLWPTFVPLAAWLVEPDQRRRKGIAAVGAVGLAVSLYLGFTLFSHDVAAHARTHRIVYDLPTFPRGMNAYPYIFATCASCLLSSLRSLNALGVFAMVTASIAASLYSYAFVSVWCFLAALISGVVISHFLWERRAVRLAWGT